MNNDPFVPRGFEQPGATAIDIRGGIMRADGPVLVAVPVRDDTIGKYLGATPGGVKDDIASSVRDVSPASKSILEAGLKTVLAATDVTGMIVEIVAPKVRPTRAGLFEIWFAGGRFWKMPVIAGGSKAFGDTFVDTDGVLIANHVPTGPNNAFSWLNFGFGNSYQIQSNGAQRFVSTDLAIISVDCDTLDEFSQVTYPNGSNAGMVTTGNIIRCPPNPNFGSGPLEWYGARHLAVDSTTVTSKVFGGVGTTIGAASAGLFSAGDVLRIEAEGSTIRRLLNGVIQNTTTDSDVATYKRIGMFDSDGRGGNVGIVVPFEGGDLVAAGGARLRRGGRGWQVIHG